jgi:hypothetical protein
MADGKGISSIEQLRTFVMSGEVVGNASLSRTSVSTHTSTQTGGYQPSTTTRVSLHSSEQLRIFVRQESGKEFEASFDDPGFGVREGHKVSVVFAGDESGGYPAALVNHSTDHRKVFQDVVTESVVRKPNQLIGCAALVAFPIVTYVGLALVSMSTGLFWDDVYQRPSGMMFFLTFIAFLAAIGLLVKRNSSHKTLIKAVLDAVKAQLKAEAARH